VAFKVSGKTEFTTDGGRSADVGPQRLAQLQLVDP
jgi:hypothetical protein